MTYSPYEVRLATLMQEFMPDIQAICAEYPAPYDFGLEGENTLVMQAGGKVFSMTSFKNIGANQ